MAAEPVAAAGLGRITLVLAQRHSGSNLARFGPTTPTRAGRLADASVDPTEARKRTFRQGIGCSVNRGDWTPSFRTTIRMGHFLLNATQQVVHWLGAELVAYS